MNQDSEKLESSFGDISFMSIIIVLMIIIAPILDLIGFILFILSFFGIGLFLSVILDVVGTITMGTLLFLFNKSTSGTEKAFKSILKKIGPRLGITASLEAIPFLGDILPSWTILVIIEIVGKIVRGK